jgi:hypothetical protein
MSVQQAERTDAHRTNATIGSEIEALTRRAIRNEEYIAQQQLALLTAYDLTIRAAADADNPHERSVLLAIRNVLGQFLADIFPREREDSGDVLFG